MKKLTVFEKYSPYWPAIAVTSLILTILFWAAYMLVSNVLIEGYLRFAAFCFFALGILSFLKVKDGRIKINLLLNEQGELEVDYLVRNKSIDHDIFDLAEFEAIEVNKMPNRSLYNDFAKRDRTVRFKRKDGKSWQYLAQVHGRVIPLEN